MEANKKFDDECYLLLRIVNDVSFAMDINHEVILRGRRSICDLGVSLFAVFGETWIDSRSAKSCDLQYITRLRSEK